MRVLELFKGGGSVTQFCEQRGWEVYSVDWDPESQADFCGDILDFEPPPGKWDILWASPDCRLFSTLQNLSLIHI